MLGGEQNGKTRAISEFGSFSINMGAIWKDVISGKKMTYSPADLILHIKLCMLEKKPLQHLYIFKLTDKFSGTFLVTIIGQRARSIAKTRQILLKLSTSGIYHLGTIFFFFYTHSLYFTLKLHDYQTKLEILAHII